MKAATNNSPERSNPAPTLRRFGYVWMVLAGSVALALGIGVYLWRPARVPEPPLPALEDADPAIVAAVEEARAVVLRSPRSASAWGHLGMVLAAHEFTTEGDLCFRQAERLDPLQPRWPYYQAVALLLGKPEAAIAKLERAAELCDTDPDAPRLRLAELLLGQGRLQEAGDQLGRLLQKNANHAKAHLGLARLACLRGDLEEGLRHLAHSRSDPRTQKDSLVLTLEISQRRGDTVVADKERRQVEQLPKDAPWPDPFMDEVFELRVGRQARIDRAGKLLARGQVQEAIGLLEETLRDYPESDWGWYLLGKALVLRKDWPRAERALTRAKQLTPDSAEVRHYLGIALYQRRDLKGAAACFRKAIELKPDYALAHYRLGLCFLDEGDSASALEALRTAVACQPTFAEAHTTLAELLARHGRPGEALRHVQQALEANPEDGKAKHLLEQLLAQLIGSIPR